ncbi:MULTISPECIES: YcxB family protein [Okeania]|uniref:YcxB family protein n=1 Tax=Okeania TaxID=1458928 RepID=UPI000F52D246|nr:MULTISPECIES: YcxB family protein [Okeania]NES79240.1 YcxB family protein [Okeania sp. SIO1H4]NET19198.1 YcxB family protein [Okeania sp. SIO1H5]NET93530.1 YcxB family protein [Okeania sp. SIO1H2]RQH16764.1 YcxB family protein [Okeania hirsuta]
MFEEEIKLTINYRIQDYIEANRIDFRSRFIFQILRFIALCYVLFLALFIAVSPHPNFYAIFVLILFLAFVFYEWTWLPFLSKNLFEKQRKFFNNQVTLIFKQDEIIEICAYQELKLRWFYKHITTPKMLLIFINPQGFIIIPKKYCSSEEQYEKICYLITKFPQGN